jgi:hypothetical protein
MGNESVGWREAGGPKMARTDDSEGESDRWGAEKSQEPREEDGDGWGGRRRGRVGATERRERATEEASGRTIEREGGKGEEGERDGPWTRTGRFRTAPWTLGCKIPPAHHLSESRI